MAEAVFNEAIVACFTEILTSQRELELRKLQKRAPKLEALRKRYRSRWRSSR